MIVSAVSRLGLVIAQRKNNDWDEQTSHEYVMGGGSSGGVLVNENNNDGRQV